MKKNNKMKMKSLLMAIIMLVAAMVIIGLTPLVENAKADDNRPDAFTWNIPGLALDNSYWNAGSTINISWERSEEATSYNLTFYDSLGVVLQKIEIQNLSASRPGPCCNNWYNWTNTSAHSTDILGAHRINVTAHNNSHSNSAENPYNWTNTTFGCITINIISGVPGYDLWQDGNYTTCGNTRNLTQYNTGDNKKSRKVLNTSTETLKYGYEGDIVVNGTLFTATGATAQDMYLWYPVYTGDGDPATTYNLTWKKFGLNGGTMAPEIDPTAGSRDLTFGEGDEGDPKLNRSGLWLIAPGTEGTTIFDASNVSRMNSTIAAWFWVNTSVDLTITTISNFNYNQTGNFKVNVKESGVDVAGAMVALVGDYNQRCVWDYNYKAEAGDTANIEYDNAIFTHGGIYDAYAYWDYDGAGTDSGEQIYYLDGSGTTGSAAYYHDHYRYYFINNTYGNRTDFSNNANYYNYRVCGPWDPPEVNATPISFTVLPGVPSYTLANDSIFWNSSGTDKGNEVNITLTGYSGEKLTVFKDSQKTISNNPMASSDIRLYNKSNKPTKTGAKEINRAYYNVSLFDNCIRITPRGALNRWGYNTSNGQIWAYAGKVYVVYCNGTGAGNASEEWNGTATFTLTSAAMQFKWIDDDGDISTDNIDEVIPYIPAITNVPSTDNLIQFQITDSNYHYWGAASVCPTRNAAENITITGNSLFTGRLDRFPGYADGWYSGGTWSVPIIPTAAVGGGTIIVAVTPWNATVSGTLSVGGTKLLTNGTVVSVTPNNFKCDQEDKTLTISVKDADGDVYKHATVYLYYIDDSSVGTAGDPIPAHTIDTITVDASGVYTMGFNRTQQTTNQTTGAGLAAIKAPRNLTIYVDGGAAGYGYALIQMTSVNDLEVETFPSTLLAGYEYEDFYINVTKVGNDTTAPDADDVGDFAFKIFDSGNNDVTSTIFSSSNHGAGDMDDDYTVQLYNVVATTAGTYRVFGSNNTHDTEGYNATLVVKQAKVICDKSSLIWKSDVNISATFTVTDEITGERLNGSLRIDNMSRVGTKYNKTWTNTSFNLYDAATDTDDNPTNASIEIEEAYLVNGRVTIHDITPNYLASGYAYQNITFWFKPASPYDGAYARCQGVVMVSVPSISSDKQYIALGRTTKVGLTVTGRGALLEDVYVRLHGKGVETNGTSGSDGVATFSILPTSTGNISMDVGESGRTVATKITVTSWVIDASVSPSDVDELDTFTVTVLREGTTTKVVGAAVTFKTETKSTDANGQVTFTAPEVTSDRTYDITVSKEGYAPDDDDIKVTVINVPKLMLSDKTVVAESTFDIAVAKDTGDPVIGATVTFNGATYTTGVGGAVTLTAPATAGDYPITASFGTFKDATATITVTAKPSEGIPGFELLTLIAAIGVAFILLRRRRH